MQGRSHQAKGKNKTVWAKKFRKGTCSGQWVSFGMLAAGLCIGGSVRRRRKEKRWEWT